MFLQEFKCVLKEKLMPIYCWRNRKSTDSDEKYSDEEISNEHYSYEYNFDE